MPLTVLLSGRNTLLHVRSLSVGILTTCAQRNMLEAETEIREDLVNFGVRVKEATHLMQMKLNAAFTEDSLEAGGP